MTRLGTFLGATLLVVAVCAGIFFGLTPSGRAVWNGWFHEVQAADDRTNYETVKKVEDTCRAMIASYEADRMTYEQYNGCGNVEQQSWADQARIRANRTAATYNNYVLQNSYVWADNIPPDIYMTLSYIG